MEAKGGIKEFGAASLVERVSRLDAVRRMGRNIEDGTRRIDVAGLRGSSPALLVEALRGQLRRPVVVCCPDNEKAHDVASDLETLSSASIHLFPEKDIFPQRFELKENLTVRGQRNACLDLIAQGEVDIIVTSLTGFLEKTIPPEVLESTTRQIRLREEIDLGALREHLVSVGYEHTPVVEEIGQFAVRGSIIDIFDPSWEFPSRLELFDNEVDSIRSFDIDTQRSIDHLEALRILPATGVLVNPPALESLEQYLTEADFPRELLEQIKHEIEHHRFSYLIRRYAPAMGMTGTLLDFFRTPPLLFFWDEERLGKALQQLEDEIGKVKKLNTDEYPILDLHAYIMPPEYYTRLDVASVHIWGLSGARRRAREAKSDDEAQDDGTAITLPDDVVTFHTREHPTIVGKFESLIQVIHKLRERNVDIQIFSESAVQRERLSDMLEDDEQLVHLPVGWMTSGFIWERAGVSVLTDHEIFHRSLPRPIHTRKTRRTQGHRPDDLQIGDFVVHVDYGIGRYIGLEKVGVYGGETECLSLRYHGTDRIFVPLDQMPLVEKYVGKEGVVPALDRLGSNKWQRTKEKTKKALEDVAREMIRAHAEREIADGHSFGADTQWQRELEASFPFEETPHQLQATEELKGDMESSRPMDRLICGDVGFGKTEVAIRATFKAVNGGKQVAILVPTTILALQHDKTFRERMQAFPVRVEMLSRFRSAAEQKQVVEGLRKGTVDVVIGTHRLLSKDIRFSDLGLLIIDEEHRFGVRSKEKLKMLKQSVDVLSLTATPIPRTLYLALSGLRPTSVIDTPPRNRHPVRTEVIPFNEETIVEAIKAEVARGGQVFFLHNRVSSIYSIQAFLERLLPDVKFGVAHGQMVERDLEKMIVAFLDKKFDVLVCTTIVESGLDFTNVNTIIINRADRFGLAELYQLRGRVGRRERQAFAYLLVPRNFSITETASRRLQAMEEFEELGSGYRLAMRDLEIRGAGNILGTEQHGRLVAVGFDLYCKMLKEAVEDIQGQPKTEIPPCRIETQLRSLLPAGYVEDQNERMAIYKRLARMEEPGEVDTLADELVDRFGQMPAEAINLTELTRMKLQAMAIGIGLIQLKPNRSVFAFLPGRALEPRLCAQLVETFQGRVLFKSGDTFGLTLSHGENEYQTDEARKLLKIAWMYDKTDNSLDRKHPTESS